MCHCRVYLSSHPISLQAEDGLAEGVDVVGELFGLAVNGDGIAVVEPSRLAPGVDVVVELFGIADGLADGLTVGY